MNLPVAAVLGELVELVDRHGALVLSAPPGTGKTTLVPPALAEGQSGSGRVILVVPRRIAARAAAARMATNHGQQVGGAFGYAVRGERRVGPQTVVEVVTPGLLLRRIQADPELDGVSCVVLDEFHERSVDQDLLLAMLIDVRSALRADLAVVIMSATLDNERVAAQLALDGERPAPILSVAAPLHPVETTWHPGSIHDPLSQRVSALIGEALRRAEGDVLVFLPGRSEIRSLQRELSRTSVSRASEQTDVLALHGTMSSRAQDEVLAGGGGIGRRVILATSIAETSLTVPGVRVVVDSGLRRSVRVDQATGLPTLDTSAVSLATAEQRRGRAGREAPGWCMRMWARRDEETRRPHDPPEILRSELSSLLLATTAWGVGSPSELRWLDPPPEPALRSARRLLVELGALDSNARLTDVGRSFVRVGFHPRVGAIANRVVERGASEVGTRLLATLEEGSTSGDLAEAVLTSSSETSPSRRSIVRWSRALQGIEDRGQHVGRHAPTDNATDPGREVADLVLAGYPDRLARRRADRPGVFLMRQGGEVQARGGALSTAEWIVAIDLDARRGESGPGRLHLGCAIPNDLVDAALDDAGLDAIEQRVTCEWDPLDGSVRTQRARYLGAIQLDTTTVRSAPGDALEAEVLRQVEARGPSVFTAWSSLQGLRARVAFAAATDTSEGSDWPDLSDDAVRLSAAQWVPLLFAGRARYERFDPTRDELASALMHAMPYERRSELDRLAPTSWTPPGDQRPSAATSSGGARRRALALSYGAIESDPGVVLLAAPLRDLIGIDAHPQIGPACATVLVELLSPAGRPLQRTTDLPGFWRGSYAQVRSEMRGRYPKHPWPERPWEPI